MNKKLPPFTLLLLTLTLLLAGCGAGSQPKGRRPSADWSRGLPVGSDLRGAVTIAVEPDGEPVHLTWPEAGADDAVAIHYEQLDRNATTVLERNLDLPGGNIHSPRLLLNRDGGITLFWAARPDGADGWQVWGTTLDARGEPTRTSQALTPAEMNVRGYAVAQESEDLQYLIWEDTRTAALYGLPLAAGQPTGPPVELAAGEGPALTVDEAGTLHLVWRRGGALYYTRYRPGTLSVTSGMQVAELDIAFGDTLDGPVMSISDGRAYVLWSIFSQSGLEAGTGRTEYIVFPVATPQQVEPQRVRIMPPEEQPYESYAGAFPLTQLVPPPPSPTMNTDYVGDPAVTSGPGAGAAAVVSANQAWRQQTVVQLALVLFGEGQLHGYQMAAKTQNVSQGATVATDATGNLYLAWGEGAGGLNAYFATTAPEMKDVINRLDPADVANLVLTSAMESVVGLLFMPLAVIWMLPGGLLTALWRMRNQQEDAASVPSRIIFAIGIVLYQGLKILFMPAILSYVPFSAWLDIPTAWQEPLTLIAPLAVFLFALLVGEIVRRRREETSTPIYFFIVAGIDGALTLIVYGVNFLGVF